MKDSELLTVGCAIFREPQIWSVLQGLHANHPHVSYLLVDNAPEPDLLARNTCHAVGGVHYHRPDLAGTSASRDAVFRLAKTPWVLCMDAHCILESGALRAALDYCRAHMDSKDLIQSPYVGDDGRQVFTHWRAEESAKPGLWGVWDTAWLTPKGRPFCIWNFNGVISWRDLSGNEISPVTGVDPHNPAKSGCKLAGWDEAWAALLRGEHRDDAGQGRPTDYSWGNAYEIPAQGLGLFMMRREAWPGFHPQFRGFGGEEGYIHAKVRQRGGRCINLPALRWRHCFRNGGKGSAQSHQVPYPMLDQQGKGHVWNLLVGHRELGIECEPQIRAHFCKGWDDAGWKKLRDEAEAAQPLGVCADRKRLKLLGVWYSNCSAPAKVLTASLRSIERAVRETMHHDVFVTTASWQVVTDQNGNPSNPFPCRLGKPDAPDGHASIIASIRNCIGRANLFEWDGICFLEHDCLYTPGYFDKMGDGLATGAPVVSNLDYAGMNGTGWLAVKERHEPMHQLSMRRDIALANLDRADADCKRQGWAYLEPDGQPVITRDTKEGLLAVDFDGTATLGWFPPSQDYVIITGRKADNLAEVEKMFGKRRVFPRPDHYSPTSEEIGMHKAETIKRLGVVEYWEDDRVQLELIRKACPGVIVHHVQGAPPQADRSAWYRIPPTATKDNPIGLCPSIHCCH